MSCSVPFFKPTLLACAIGMALPALAQTTAAPTTLGEVVVSASADASAAGLTKPYAGGQVARGGRVGILGNQDMMDTPFSGTSYTNELIQNQQARSVADVLQNDPTVRVARGFGNFQELYMIRGFNVYSDDMAYNGLYGLLPRQYLSAELLERVEVFRGASAFLNGAAPGSSGIGGSINVLPKRAANDPLTQVTFGIESGGQYLAAVDMSRRFGEDKSSGLRLNAVRRNGDTAVDNESRELSALALGWDWRSRDVRVSADLGYQDHKLNQSRPSVSINDFVTTAIPKAPDASKNYAQPWTYSNEKDTFGTVRAEVDLNDNVTAWFAAGARKSKEDNVLAGPTVLNANGDTLWNRSDNVKEDSVNTAEIGVRGKLQSGSVGHSWVASASTFHMKSRNAYSWSPYLGLAGNLYDPVTVPAPATGAGVGGFAGGDMGEPLITERTDLDSIALADTLSFANDRLLLTLGARQQTIRSRNFDYNSGAQSDDYQKTKVTPIAGVVFKASKQMSLYANYIEGLQKGERAPATASNPNAVATPYVSEQKEVGVKYDGGKFGGSLSLFNVSKALGYVDASNTFVTDGEQRNRGVELSMFGEVQRGLRMLGGLTLLDAEQVKSNVPANNGKDALGVPKTMANIGAEWDVPGVSGLSLNGRVVYTSSQYANAANTLEIPSWTRVDLGARYLTTIADKLVTWRARVDNVTNRDYWASAGGYPGQGYMVLGAPRTFVLSASVEF